MTALIDRLTLSRIRAMTEHFMTKEQLAVKLHGREYGDEITGQEAEQARSAGLVVLYGASDDLAEFEGAFRDEADCYDGGDIYIDEKGALPERDQIDDDEALEKWFKRKRSARLIRAVWNTGQYSWQYSTDIPHACFDVMENGEKYCRGIVFELTSL